MWYYKKKDILERLGKDGKDVRYLERAVARWEVIEEQGRWSIADDDNEVWVLLERIKELEAEVKELKKSEWLNSLNFEQTADILKLKEELEEALANADYYREAYDELLEDRRNRLEKGFKWIKANPNKVKFVKFEDWYKWVLSEDDYLGNED